MHHERPDLNDDHCPAITDRRRGSQADLSAASGADPPSWTLLRGFSVRAEGRASSGDTAGMGTPRGSGTGSRLPVLIRPMLATPAPLPSAAEDRQWAYEVKWDGVRAVAYLQDGQLRLMSRTDRDITRRYPELAALATSLRGEAVVLDGELVSLDAGSRPSFGRLQHRMHAVDQTEIRRLVGRYPVMYMIFDLLHGDGQSLLAQPYVERRTRLNELNPTGPAWQTPPSWIGGGADILAATAEQGLEGIIAKRTTSTYQPGRRSPSWRKIKNIRTVDVLIGGWSPGSGRRTGTIGSLLVGVSTQDGLAGRSAAA